MEIASWFLEEISLIQSFLYKVYSIGDKIVLQFDNIILSLLVVGDIIEFTGCTNVIICSEEVLFSGFWELSILVFQQSRYWRIHPRSHFPYNYYITFFTRCIIQGVPFILQHLDITLERRKLYCLECTMRHLTIILTILSSKLERMICFTFERITGDGAGID